MSSNYRTTPDDVRAELEADASFDNQPIDLELISNDQIKTVGLVPATLEVDETLADTDMSDDRLELIVRYLAGHFIMTSGVDQFRQVDSKSLDDGSSYDFAGDRDRDDYGSTSLGQKAITLDTSGQLATTNKPPATIHSPDARGSRRSGRR